MFFSAVATLFIYPHTPLSSTVFFIIWWTVAVATFNLFLVWSFHRFDKSAIEIVWKSSRHTRMDRVRSNTKMSNKIRNPRLDSMWRQKEADECGSWRSEEKKNKEKREEKFTTEKVSPKWQQTYQKSSFLINTSKSCKSSGRPRRSCKVRRKSFTASVFAKVLRTTLIQQFSSALELWNSIRRRIEHWTESERRKKK